MKGLFSPSLAPLEVTDLCNPAPLPKAKCEVMVRPGDSWRSLGNGDIMQKRLAVAALILMTLGSFLGVEIMTASVAKANFSAYDEPVPKKPKKKTVKKEVKKPTIQARKKQYQLQRRRAATQATTRIQHRQIRCGALFRCMFTTLRDAPRVWQLPGVDRPTRTTVAWAMAKYAPGSIIVKTPERALYYVLPDGQGAALSGRRRQGRLPVERKRQDHHEAGMAVLAPAEANDRA